MQAIRAGKSKKSVGKDGISLELIKGLAALGRAAGGLV